LRSAALARLAYTERDGLPRVIPIGFHWDGKQLVVCTAPTAQRLAGADRRDLERSAAEWRVMPCWDVIAERNEERSSIAQPGYCIRRSTSTTTGEPYGANQGRSFGSGEEGCGYAQT